MGTLQIRNPKAGQLPARAFFALALLAVIGVVTPALHSQDEASQPARAIRLGFVDGKVQLSRGDQTIADQAVINTPLLQGTTLATGDDGKAEIQFEDGSVARLAPNTTLTLSTLAGSGTSGEADVTLERGQGYFELQSSGQMGSIRIHFGDSTINASGFTILRVQFDTPPGAVAVFSGNAHLERGNSVFLDLHGGESLAFNTNSASSYDLNESIPSDSWDAWNADRDQQLNAEAASQTNAPNDLAPGQTSNPAWSDLDSNGSWYNVPGQGYVWSPYEAANSGFDPYGSGSWVWMPGFGYTWASGYSWGYLPFSCGAWNFYNDFGWGWAPGFGGCSPWWNIGFYGGPVIGFAPGWYHLVHRPGPPPGHPWPRHPVPVIAVSRHEPGVGNPLPPRDRNTPVNIGGATVVGMRPSPGRTSPRPGIVVRGLTTGYQGGGMSNRPAYSVPRNGYDSPSQGANAPQPGNTQPQRPSGFTPQPGHNYGPPTNRGNITPNAPVPSSPVPSTPSPRPYTPPPAPSPAPRPYSPAPRPYSPPPTAAPAPHPYTPPPAQPSRPSNPGGGGPGGGYHPGAAPNPGAGGGGGVHGGGNTGGQKSK